MAINFFTIVSLSLAASLQLMSTGSDAIHVNINPEKCISSLDSLVQISCLPDTVVDKTKEVTVIEIYRNDDDPIAFLRDCSNITYGKNIASSKFQAQGYIDNSYGQSYLNLSLTNPRTEDTGIYTCVIYYLDKAGHLKEERSSENLIVEKLDIGSLETILTQLKKKTEENKEMISSLEKRKKGTHRSAFYATMSDSSVTTKAGQTIIFSKVIMKEGHGYNETNGVFTAPVTALYNFHLVVRMYNTGNWLWVNLMINEKTRIQLKAGAKESTDQSSISMVTKLDVGDQVKPVVHSINGNGRIYGEPNSAFSGYLL